MVWKVEKWLQEVFPGEEKIYSEYRDLAPRELVIVGVGVLDLSLAELITRRLLDYGGEAEAFLGLNGDGRAPAGSIGARIQLALLLGIITTEDATVLRAMKELRNVVAHRVRVDFLSEPAQRALRKIYAVWLNKTRGLISAGYLKGSSERLSELGNFISSIPEAGQGLFLSVFTVYQAYFHRLYDRIPRLSSTLDLARSQPGQPGPVN
jgi:hypothetical protein